MCTVEQLMGLTQTNRHGNPTILTLIPEPDGEKTEVLAERSASGNPLQSSVLEDVFPPVAPVRVAERSALANADGERVLEENISASLSRGSGGKGLAAKPLQSNVSGGAIFRPVDIFSPALATDDSWQAEAERRYYELMGWSLII